MPSLVPQHAALRSFVLARLPRAEGVELITDEALHHSDDPAVALAAAQLRDAASRATGRALAIERMWALVHRPPHPPAPPELTWHRHICAASLVYYLQVPDDLRYPEGSFSFLAPEPMHLMPREGTTVIFDHRLYHDAYPPTHSRGTRIALAVDFEWA
jgi:hypothetical protein